MQVFAQYTIALLDRGENLAYVLSNFGGITLTFTLPETLSMDMHVHSSFSDAPYNTIEIIEDICQSKNIGLCVCDHNEIRGSIQLFDRGKVCTIPSIEIGSSENLEFLIYFETPDKLEEFFIKHVEPFKRPHFFTKLNASFQELLPAANSYGGLIGLPHPFAPGWKNIKHGHKRKQNLFSQSILNRIKLVEVINGHLPDNRNFKALVFCEEYNKYPIVGSDSHVPSTLGTVTLKFNNLSTYQDVFKLINKNFRFQKEERFSAVRFASTSFSVVGAHIKLFFTFSPMSAR